MMEILSMDHIQSVDPENISSGIKTMTSSYTQSITNVYDRPSESDFPLGFFVEDYVYNTQNGDLDKNNGRFAKTKIFQMESMHIMQL